LQWRLAVGATLGYFAFFLFTPVMYSFHGQAVAGRMFATWTVVTAIQAAALAWVQTRAPLFGMLVSRGDRKELDRVFLRVGGLAVAAFVIAAVAFWGLIWCLNVAESKAAGRLLEPGPTAIFLAAALVQIGVSSLAFYVRAHKREPFLWVGIASNLAVGFGVWQLGARYGPSGAGIALLAANVVITLPTHIIIWRRCRRDYGD